MIKKQNILLDIYHEQIRHHNKVEQILVEIRDFLLGLPDKTDNKERPKYIRKEQQKDNMHARKSYYSCQYKHSGKIINVICWGLDNKMDRIRHFLKVCKNSGFKDIADNFDEYTFYTHSVTQEQIAKFIQNKKHNVIYDKSFRIVYKRNKEACSIIEKDYKKKNPKGNLYRSK